MYKKPWPIAIGVIMCLIIGILLSRGMMGKESADVVIIGAGASGMSAAIEAEAIGAKVILLEKMPYVGGNSLRATGGINASMTPQQEALGIKDSHESYIDDMLKAGHYKNNERLVEYLVHESGDAIEWLTDLGANLDDVGILAGHSMARTHRPEGGKQVGGEIVHVLEEQIRSRAIDLRLENTAMELVVDDGKVTGVIAQDKSGKIYTIEAGNVIIATGGFGGSPETFVYYNKKLKGYDTTNSPGATGDFIQLVEPLDVDLVDMEYIQTHPTVSSEFGILITEAIRGNGGILINNSGKRFADELQNRDILSAIILEQDQKEVYLLFNETVRASLDSSNHYINMDIALTGEDIESLSAALRIDSSNLRKTLEDYNGYVENKKDEAFSRRSLKVKLEEGPFYAIQVIPGVHYCMGGMRINEKGQVMNRSMEPIEGLYGAGEATGGIHGMNRLGGSSLIDAIVFGRQAGRQAGMNH